MPLYTSTYLKRLSEKKSPSMNNKILNESKIQHTSFDVFLSHSYLDKDAVEGIYIELTEQGYSVYVDWIIDPGLNRNNVTKETATLIRKRLQMSKCLLLAVSTNLSLSKWIPWELGVVDGHTSQCAILPVSPGSTPVTSFKGSEYLSLYPYIKKATLAFSEDIFLIESSTSYVSVKNWMGKNEMPSFKYQNIDLL